MDSTLGKGLVMILKNGCHLALIELADECYLKKILDILENPDFCYLRRNDQVGDMVYKGTLHRYLSSILVLDFRDKTQSPE